MYNIQPMEYIKLECGIEVAPYLTYAQIQQIVDAATQFKTWAERETNIDVLTLYHATNLEKKDIEEIGHDAFVQSGIMDEVKLCIHNFNKIYEGITYTESIHRALSMLAQQLPLMNEVLEKVGDNAKSKK